MQVRTRFAPSPTGFLHVGGAYSALLDYAFAKKHKGKFVVRIEDTDIKRYVKGAEEAVYEGLDWLGIVPDESPKVGGPYGPYRQSERLEIYQKYARQLVQQGDAYCCFCSPERLKEVREAKLRKKLPPMYDRRCRSLSEKEVKERAGKEKFVIRMKVPEKETIVINEPLRGEVKFDSQVLDDQVLLKSDGYPTYHLAVVVDDHLMKITHAVRGEEWLSSAPKHILLYRYFGWEPPVYFHTPTLRDSDRSKLSKRRGHTALSWYQEQGYLPEALVNFLCLLGWSHPKEKEVFSLKEFIKFFELEDLSPVGPVFNLQKLEWLNGQYIRKKSDEELSRLIKNFISDKKLAGKSALIDQTIPLIKTRISKLSDYWPLCSFFFEEPELKKSLFKGEKDKEYLEEALSVLEKLEVWKEEKIVGLLQDLIAKNDWKTGKFFMAFRIALAGSRVTPPITDSAAILGSKTTFLRLQKALKVLTFEE